MEAYLRFVGKFPKTILLSLTLLTLAFGYFTQYLSEDSNPYLLPEDHPARAPLYEMRDKFTGTYDSILITLYNDNSIFNPTSLKALFELTEDVRQLHFTNEADVKNLRDMAERYPNVPELNDLTTAILNNGLDQTDIPLVREAAEKAQHWPLSARDKKQWQIIAERLDPIREMAGMSASENVYLEADGTLRAAISVNSATPDVAIIEKAVMNNELMDMGVIDRAGKVGLIVLEISVLEDDAEGQVRAYDAVQQMVADYQQQHPELTDDVYIGGVPVFFAEQKKIMDADMATLFPAVVLLVSLVLACFFRSTLGVVIPLVNVIMCTVWTMGGMALVGIPMDLITAALPVFLITICSSDAIHVMAEYYHQRRHASTQMLAVKNTLRLMASPVILTTITTCITFLVSTTTSISNLRHFGICMSFGMFVAMIISLLLIPAWLALVPANKSRSEIADKEQDNYLLSKMLLATLRPIMRQRRLSIAIFSAVLIGLLGLASQVRIDDMGSGYFAPNNQYRIADDFINQHIAGTSPGWIEIDTGVRDGALSYQTVEFIDKLEKFIHQQDNITFSYSVARYIRRINFVLNNENPAYDRLPSLIETFEEIDEDSGESYTISIDGNDIIRQAILMYENGGGSDLTNVLSEDFSKTVLLYTMNTTVASDFDAFLSELRPWLAQNTPDGMTYQLAGSPVIWTAVLDELLSGQLQSIALAFSCVVLVMAAWMKSIRMGLIGTLPLAVTVVFYYATMTVFDIELNIGTAIISFLVLGVVDYSVHYLLRTQHGLEQGLTMDQALEQAIIHSGRSIIANVLVFSVGFVALLFSEFKPIVDLGLLVGLSLLISGLMSILVITLFGPWLIPNREIVGEVAVA